MKAKPDTALVEIPLTEQGAIADEIKLIAWAPGCRVATFDIKIDGTDLHESYSCKPSPSILLVGQVDKAVLIRHQGLAEVRVDYLAGWACDFFRFNDCMMPQFLIAGANVDSTGRFEINLPDFSSVPVPNLSSAVTGFRVALREINTQDATLSPESKPLRTLDGELRVESEYPSVVRFIAQKQN